MKPFKIVFTTISLFLFFISTGQEKYSKIKFYPATTEERNNLLGLLEIDHFFAEGNAIISEVSQRSLNNLKGKKVRYEILVDDVARNLQIRNKKFYANRAKGINRSQNRVAMEQENKTVSNIIATPDWFEVKNTFGGYYSYAEMVTAMNNLVAVNSNLVQKIAIGTTLGFNFNSITVAPQTIWAIKISDNVGTDDLDEPEVLYLGLQHAREAITGSSMIFFMQYLVKNYDTDEKIKNLIDNREIYIVPCVNPDGYEYNRRSENGDAGGGHRKNMRNNNATNPGVDLNRNYGTDWGTCGSVTCGSTAQCGSSSTSGETYYGPSAFSEPETQAIRTLVQSRHFVAAIDQHAYGPYYSLPFGKTSRTLNATDQKFYTIIPALMGQYNGMRAGNSCESVGYEVAGGIKDWLLIGDIGTGTKGKIYGMTGEGGAGGGTPAFGSTLQNFWAPADQIENLCKGMCYQNLQLAYAAGSYVDIQDASDIALTSKTGNLSFKITRIGLEDKPVKISLIAGENVSTTGSFVTINSLPNYYDTYTGNISYTLPAALGNGQRVKFTWKVETGGYTYTETVVKFLNPTQLLYDDMEGADVATNWTVSAGQWNYSTAGAFAGTKSFTESPSGRYTTSTTRTATYKNTFNLSDATAAYLTFWTRHRAENFRDKLQVQVSTNGTTWVAVPGSTTVQEPGTLDGSTLNGQPSLTGIRDLWTREVFDISAYKGAANLRLRFNFTSDPTSSSGFDYQTDDGFYIDNLKVIKSTAVLITLPVNFLNFYGKLLSDKSVELNWEAVTDNSHDHFEIERSKDGISYMRIGYGNQIPPYVFIDNAPAIGNNYYRIKQVDKDGRNSFSKTINIVVQPDFDVTVYPNPVSDVLSVNLISKEEQTINIQITDLQGRIVYSQRRSANKGFDNMDINVQNLQPQVYLLKVSNNKNEVLVNQKVIKL